jgi:hypothetical protein
MFLGSREDIAHLGYVQGVCPKCGKTGSFTVYLAKRRMTISMFAALPMGEQHVLECRHCQARFAIPPEMKDQLQARLITADRLADLVEQLPDQSEREARPVRTLYQTLQVDQDADPDVIEAAFKIAARIRKRPPKCARCCRRRMYWRIRNDGLPTTAASASSGSRRNRSRSARRTSRRGG